MNKEVIFPGSFDPFHKGHQYVVERALEQFDFVYIIVSWNENKKRLSSFQKTKNEIEKIYRDNQKIKVLINEDKLTVDVAKELNCFNIIRGYRNNEDKQYEESLAKMYIKENPKIKIYYIESSNDYKEERSSKLRDKK